MMRSMRAVYMYGGYRVKSDAALTTPLASTALSLFTVPLSVVGDEGSSSNAALYWGDNFVITRERSITY